MIDITAALRNTISISLFDRGLAGKIFEEVKRSGARVVMKNNAPECVLLSPEEYLKLMDEINDAHLLAIAAERMQNFDSEALLDGDQVYAELGITKEDIANFDDIDIE